MIIHKDLMQGSYEWLETRYRKISGTSSKGLFVKSDTLYLDLLSQHLEEYEPEDIFITPAMERGLDLEPYAREYLSEYSGIAFKEVGWIQSKQCGIVGISPDGISDCETKMCEIKCLGRTAHTKVLVNDEIPSEYTGQVLHYFTVNPKLEELWFICFRPESVSHFIKVFKRNTLIDMGLKRRVEIPQFGKKGQPIKSKFVSRPDLKPIDEWAKMSMKKAIELEGKIKIHLKRLAF